MTSLEKAVLLAGCALLVVALAAIDWRVGLAALGILLIASTLDLRVRT